MIHYHGTPLTPRSELQKLAGKNFCVSFADPRDADWCLAHAQSVMWDNGAYSHFTQDKDKKNFGPEADGYAYWNDYFDWLEPRLGHPHWAVQPDIIDGDVESQRDLTQHAPWPFDALFGAPVWHMALSIDWLLEIADHWPRFCFGSSGRYWQVGSLEWERRCDLAWNALEKRGLRPWVHMMRGLSIAGGNRWPFSSADSVNVARNYKDTATCPEHMARRIDAIQTPVSWSSQPEQIALEMANKIAMRK